MYFASVDCGGTKTAFLMTDGLGKEVARCYLGPGNYLVTGLEETTDLINEGIENLCKQANIDKSEITMALIASAGYSSNHKDPRYDEAAKRKYHFNYYVTGDVSNAMKGSLLNSEGIHLIAGTGSVGKGTDGKTVFPSIGGWGYYVGADEGGGYWIGSSLLRHFERQADGREEKTLLYDYMFKKYNFKVDHDCLYLIIDTFENKRDKIATVALDVVELCKLGDPVAKQIMFDAGVELAKIAKAIYRRDHYKDPVTISYSGSVFKSIEYLRPGIEEELKDIPHNFCDPILRPLAGGIVLAMEKANYEYNDEIINNLKKIAD